MIFLSKQKNILYKDSDSTSGKALSSPSKCFSHGYLQGWLVVFQDLVGAISRYGKISIVSTMEWSDDRRL
jgi:hypothetical protein